MLESSMIGLSNLYKEYITSAEELKSIAAYVSNRENVSILWLPGGGRTTFGIDLQNKPVLKRVTTLTSKSRIAKTLIIYVDLSLDCLQLEKYLDEVLSKYSIHTTLRGKISDVIKKNYLYFVLDNVNIKNLPTFNYLLSFRSQSSSKIRFICQFLEKDFFEFIKTSSDVPSSIFHNVVRIPYLSQTQAIEAVKYKAKSLRIKIKHEQAEELYVYCGGVPVLLTASLRNLRLYRNTAEMFENFEMKNIIDSYWSKFSENEKQIIGCAAYKRPLPNLPREIDYLRKHRLLNIDNSFDKLWLKYV